MRINCIVHRGCALGKGEVESSILSGSTKKAEKIKGFSEGALPFLPVLEREQSSC
jgi:hypothetical protein